MAKTIVTVSQGVADDFNKAEYYQKQISRSKAQYLMDGYLDRWYKYALERGWTEAKDIAEYVEKDHGPIYTAVFLILS